MNSMLLFLIHASLYRVSQKQHVNITLLNMVKVDMISSDLPIVHIFKEDNMSYTVLLYCRKRIVSYPKMIMSQLIRRWM